MCAATNVLDAIEQQAKILEAEMRHSIVVRLFIAVCICASMITLLLLVAASHATNAEATSLNSPIDYYGRSIDQLVLLGQDKIGETGRNKVGPNGIYHASGVLVDRNAPADKLYIYVADTGNNRILGFDYSCEISGTCQMDGTRPASIVLGQPDMTTASCNGDNNLGFNQSPTSSTLCLIGYPFTNNTAEYWMRTNIDVDSQGNLYVPDVWNNRVLKFNQPLSADKTDGKGDAIADFVWGQNDMTSNGRNRGSNYGPVNSPDDRSLWISFGPPDHVSSRGVSVDAGGNIWVADTFNNRVLRFPPDSKQANLVLGQPDFTSSGCVSNGPLDRMCTPTLAKVHPTTSKLYVLDEYPAPFRARLLEFTPPFTNGMSATRVITPNQDGPFTNWDGWDGTGAYIFQSTGFVFNTFREGEYADGEIWLNEHSANRALLIDLDGNIIEVVGAKDKYSRGGDVSFIGCSGNIYTGNYVWWPGGSIGLDDTNQIYLADEFFHTVFRYALPYETHQEGSAICLPEANGVLFPKGPNQRSSDRLGESVGLAVFDNQLLVRDEGMRMKVYDNYLTQPFGADADHVLTGGFQGRNWLSGGIDDANRLWLSGEHGQIRIYQLPITSSTATPIADFVKLYWADTGTEVTRPDGVNYVQIGAMAFDQNHHAMYIADAVGTRIFRVSNYNEFTDKLYVDMVIGQRNKTEVRCNQGLSAPNAETLCTVTQIKFDRQGNLFVVDNAYECHDNRRIVVFNADDLNSAATLFPNLQASIVFNAPDFNHVGDCAYWTVDKPGSPVSLAFNSRNQMVVGNDGYYGDPEQRQLGQLWFYVDPLNKQTPDASIALYMGTPGEIAFDQNDNLIIQDHTWYKVWVINLDTDPEWLEYFPGVPTLADFKASPTSGTFPLTVKFTNTSINYTTSLWSLGDGMTSTLQSPTHTYTMAGAYTVTLTVSRELSETNTLTRTNYIIVSEPLKVYLPLVLRGY